MTHTGVPAGRSFVRGVDIGCLLATRDAEIGKIGPGPSGCGEKRAILHSRPRRWARHSLRARIHLHPTNQDLFAGAPGLARFSLATLPTAICRYTLAVMALAGALAAPAAMRAQAADDAAKNALQARAALDRMVQALGGPAWLQMQNQMRVGYIATFYHGVPDPGTTEYYEYHQWPDKDRVELTKHRDVLEFYEGRAGWEVTYRGKKAMDAEGLEDYLRRRDHSLETVVKVWLKDPNTILVYEGQHMASRHMAEQVTLISAQNEAVTIQMDVDTHLPLNRSFQWRDPEYKDKNTDMEEYDDYHTIDGLPTPLSITRYKNGEMVRQYYVRKVEFNQTLPADFWDVDAAANRVKK